jgi:hypothetical protein
VERLERPCRVWQARWRSRGRVSTRFTALDVASGQAIGSLHRRHLAIEFEKFLAKFINQVPVAGHQPRRRGNRPRQRHEQSRRRLAARRSAGGRAAFMRATG